MKAVTAAAQMTAAQFLALPERTTAGRLELIDGELVVNEPTRMHNESQNCINVALREWVRAAPRRGWAGLPLDVRFDDRNVHAPDVVWYRERRAPRRDDPPPYAVPDLVVEVRSKSTWRVDVGRKKRNYERHGVAELWLVDTAANLVLVYGRSRPDVPLFDARRDLSPGATLTSPLLPGFELAVGEIFEID